MVDTSFRHGISEEVGVFRSIATISHHFIHVSDIDLSTFNVPTVLCQILSQIVDVFFFKSCVVNQCISKDSASSTTTTTYSSNSVSRDITRLKVIHAEPLLLKLLFHVLCPSIPICEGLFKLSRKGNKSPLSHIIHALNRLREWALAKILVSTELFKTVDLLIVVKGGISSLS